MEFEALLVQMHQDTLAAAAALPQLFTEARALELTKMFGRSDLPKLHLMHLLRSQLKSDDFREFDKNSVEKNFEALQEDMANLKRFGSHKPELGFLVDARRQHLMNRSEYAIALLILSVRQARQGLLLHCVQPNFWARTAAKTLLKFLNMNFPSDVPASHLTDPVTLAAVSECLLAAWERWIGTERERKAAQRAAKKVAQAASTKATRANNNRNNNNNNNNEDDDSGDDSECDEHRDENDVASITWVTNNRVAVHNSAIALGTGVPSAVTRTPTSRASVSAVAKNVENGKTNALKSTRRAREDPNDAA